LPLPPQDWRPGRPLQGRKYEYVGKDDLQDPLKDLETLSPQHRVGFTVAHQYLHQLEPDIGHAVLGNTGSIVAFRVRAEDTTYLVREFRERLTELDNAASKSPWNVIKAF
jgi:hypothetical protein